MADPRHREQLLVNFARDCENSAAALHRFRDSLPQHAARIAALVGEFFTISSILRQIHTDEGSRRYGPSFYRIDADLALVFRSLRPTIQDLLDMFARAREQPAHMVWEDLCYHHEREEDSDLLQRLELYRHFLNALYDVLEGRQAESSPAQRQMIGELVAAQQHVRNRGHRIPAEISGASTPRPRPRMPSRLSRPSSPTVMPDYWDNAGDTAFNRPTAPDAPPPMMHPFSPMQSPTSQTFTSFSSSSSQAMSSHTSLSSDVSYIHWVQNVFDGSNPTTPYKPQYQLSDRSACYGEDDPVALHRLATDGFTHVLDLSFDANRLYATFYWRPSDLRARVLLTVPPTSTSQLPTYYCQPLTALRIIRKGTTLQLCRATRTPARYKLWARLNFLLHERMVLFFASYLALKHQDSAGVSHPHLLEDVNQLQTEDEEGEKLHFAGQIKHGEMLHALRLYRDRASGVVRLEASALRGSRQDIPIWTAFVTRNNWDPDWAEIEENQSRPGGGGGGGGGRHRSRSGPCVVSLAAIRPAPFVFLSRYEPPKDQTGRYVLPFGSREDARMFVEEWRNICRRHGR